MIETKPVNISTIAGVFQIHTRTLNFWYKHTISNYERDKKCGIFCPTKAHQVDEDTGEVIKEVQVHILIKENLGESLNIDEKMIGKKYCTILSNTETGKIVLLVESMNPEIIKDAISQLGNEGLNRVKNICSDMSPMFKKICREIFKNAHLTVDKYHVMKHVLDALQAHRIELKNEEKLEIEKRIVPQIGWSRVQLLSKSRYLLYKPRNRWSNDEIEISKLLFAYFPSLRKSYDLVEECRNWYSKEHIGKPKWWLERELENWLDRLEDYKSKHFKFVRKMFVKHEQEIINYFINGHTNAKAENLNGKIQRFTSSSYGFRNRDFFYYRLQVYFA